MSDEWFSYGKWTYGNPQCLRMSDRFKLRLGAFCSIADTSTFILDGGHEYRNVSSYPFHKMTGEQYEPKGGDITVGNDVWIGSGSLILPNAIIGNGAVIGAACVVRGHVPDYAICVGNPWKIKGFRFGPEAIRKLLAIKWWDWPDEKILQNRELLEGKNIEKFLEKHYD